MYCGVCSYSWCWVCGTRTHNCWHKISGDGAGCELINSIFNLRYDKNSCLSYVPTPIYLLLGLILYLIAPYFIYVFGTLALTFTSVYESFYRSHRYKYRDSKWKIILISVLIIWPLMSPFVILGTTLAFVLIIIPYHLLLIIGILITFYNWCLKSKRVVHSKDQQDLIDKRLENLKK